MKQKMLRYLAFLMAAVLLVNMLLPQTCYAASSKTSYYIKINRQQNCVTIYQKDAKGNYTVPVKAMVCSTGVNNATPLGKFKLGGKYRWHELMGPVYGQYCCRITGHVLFHSVYYSTTDPSTLNYNAYNRLGTAASHGCVRLTVADAKWIYDNCSSGTTVEIYDSSNPGPLGKPTATKIDTSSKYRGWDPTDPDARNPWPKKTKATPTIKGAKNKTVERGSAKTVLTKGVSASDYSGKKLKVKVSGTYDLNKTGKYKITYKATDSYGNVAKKTVTITVKDTKKPTLTIDVSELTFMDDVDVFLSAKAMKNYIKQFVTAKDSGEELADKYITVTLGELWDAWCNGTYGTYKVKVYAKDKAGNKSKVKTITIYYQGQEEPETPEIPETEEPVTPEPGDSVTSEPGNVTSEPEGM